MENLTAKALHRTNLIDGTYTMERTSRASLCWQRRPENDQGYWDESALHSWIDYHRTDISKKDAEFGEISHLTLHVFVTLLAQRLHEIITDLIKDDDVFTQHTHGTSISFSVAIAIPEGIFLPLSVAATHALNDSEVSAVLVPMDPAEGNERLRRLLSDCRPVLVLVAADCDFKSMQQLTSQEAPRTSELYRVFDSSQPLFLASETHVLDVRSIAKEISLKVELKERIATLESNQTCWDTTVERNIRTRIRSISNYVLGEAKNSCFQAPAKNCISHIVYTSGTTGFPKGCIASRNALDAYLEAKNKIHKVSVESVVLLASAVSFDPCFSDILATINAGATMFLTSRESLSAHLNETLALGNVSHVLCTPTLWSTLAIHDADPAKFPNLRVVALGGEHIPKHIIRTWARQGAQDNQPCRLFATYGVTEACVYQTMGEVFLDSRPHVGVPFDGTSVFILEQASNDCALAVMNEPMSGEIVLYGDQVDEYSSYLRRHELTQRKFHFEMNHGRHCYRTGDRGFLDRDTGNLHVAGRIDGEEGMVKYNGIRIELGEIESAIIDDIGTNSTFVVECMVLLKEVRNEHGERVSKDLHAYIVLGKQCLEEFGVNQAIPDTGVLCSGDLVVPLVARCKRMVRVTPTAFIIIPSIPLTRTGKRNKSFVPNLEEVVPLSVFINCGSSKDQVILSEYSPLGALVSEQIVDCLNLLPCQLTLLTTSATFAMLGGDSLTATRVVRALYAHHYNVFNGRELGGAHGILDDDVFSVRHLLRANNLGEYVDLLQRNNVCCNPAPLGDPNSPTRPNNGSSVNQEKAEEGQEDTYMYDALVRAITQNKTQLALALLDAGAPTNLGDQRKRKYRISNTRGLQERKTIFHTTPLHLSCLKGHPKLVHALLLKTAKFNTPDAAGMFPLHLAAAGGIHGDEYNEEEDWRRLECVKLLLASGAPIQMKDGNKHTLLHCAARSGFNRVLEFALEHWKKDFIPSDPVKHKGSLDWRDRWSRTPVHWAILNGKINALRILLDHGCSSTPVKPKKNARTNAALETPQEMCDRIYGDNPNGHAISKLLKEAQN
eukprot:scaffold5364_cov164-Amphora_coffeaeformis.AAC.37